MCVPAEKRTSTLEYYYSYGMYLLYYSVTIFFWRATAEFCWRAACPLAKLVWGSRTRTDAARKCPSSRGALGAKLGLKLVGQDCTRTKECKIMSTISARVMCSCDARCLLSTPSDHRKDEAPVNELTSNNKWTSCICLACCTQQLNRRVLNRRYTGT